MVIISIVSGSFSIRQIEEILKARYGRRAPSWDWNVKRMGDVFVVRFPQHLLTVNFQYNFNFTMGRINLRRWSPRFGSVSREKETFWILLKNAPLVCCKLDVLQAALEDYGDVERV